MNLEGLQNLNLFLKIHFTKKIGMSSMRVRNGILKASNDLMTWETVGEGTSPLTISATHKNHRYWKVYAYNNTSAWGLDQISSTESASLKNIHFTSAPAVGATVSVTYQPDCIAKDASHVLNNVKVVVQFNEYTPT